MRGKLIVIDGSDGVGKKTQTALLVERLRNEGRTIRTLDFPRYKDNFFGAFIRECLDGKHGNFVETSPYLASIPYAVDRLESKAILEGWIAAGEDVVLDRYVSANQMHQGGKVKGDSEREKFLMWLDTMEHEVFKLPRPDLIAYLHVPVAITLSLMDGRGAKDQHESDPKHLEDAQQSALKLIRSRGNWQMVDCTDGKAILSREEIHSRIYDCVQKTLVS